MFLVVPQLSKTASELNTQFVINSFIVSFSIASRTSKIRKSSLMRFLITKKLIIFCLVLPCHKS